jgi:D-amino peptidase
MKDLKIYLEVDMEGISNITYLKQIIPGYQEWEKAREYMTKDVNAAIRGILKAAEEQGRNAIIDVADSHWKMMNILPHELDRKVNSLIRGVENRRYPQVPGIDNSYDALVCVGNHDHTNGPGVLSHTWLPGWEWTVNGTVVSETGLNGYTAGAHNVPLIFVAGDDVITAKTKELCKQFDSDVEIAVVKEAKGWESAMCYSFERTHKAIEEGAYKAVMGLEKGIHKPLVCEGSSAITIQLPDEDKPGKVLKDIANTEYVGDTTIKITRETFEEAVAVGAQVLDMFYLNTISPFEVYEKL